MYFFYFYCFPSVLSLAGGYCRSNTMPATISTILLLLNALWDLASAASIGAGRCAWIADAHLALWTDDAGRAASVLMAVLLLQWGAIRLHGAVAGPTSEAACSDASVTYVLEGAWVAFEVMAGHMHPLSGWSVVTACVVCWGLVVRECVES